MPSHIALAYSGGLDTTFLVHWLRTTYNAKVTAVLIDLGQDQASLEAAKARAITNGAQDCLIVPALEAFAEHYLAPAIQANALYEGAYPLATALARPLIATCLVDAAMAVGADAVAHGCTGKGNDQVRIEASVKALAPQLECLAPQRDHNFTRDSVLEYCAAHNVHLPELKSSPFSTDENMWGRSVEGNELEDPAIAPPENAFAWTTNPYQAPGVGVDIHLTFQDGVPTAVDGVAMTLPGLIAHLNALAGSHGIGRIDHVENRLVGIKSREIYEAPAAVTILAAKAALESLCLSRDEASLKVAMEQHFARLVYDGQWYAPVRKAVMAFLATIQSNVNGTAVVHAYKGSLTIKSRTATHSLYNLDLATYETGDQFDHKAASGFIDIWSLPMQVAASARAQKPALVQQVWP